MAIDNGRRALVKALEDAYAMEAHMVEVLEDHAKDDQAEPMYRQGIERHLRQTEQHRDRIEQRLNALGESKPVVKGGLSSILGQMMGGVSGARQASLAKNARDDYASEHMEIASYVELITLAQALGDQDTVRTAQLNLRDEVEMQQWVMQNLPQLTVKSLEKEGVRLPVGATQSVQNIFSDLGIGIFGGQPQTMGTGQQRTAAGTQPGYDVGQPSGMGTGQPGYGTGQPGYGTSDPGLGRTPGYSDREGPVTRDTPDRPPNVIP